MSMLSVFNMKIYVLYLHRIYITSFQYIMYDFRDIRTILTLKMIYEVLRKVINVVNTCFY